MFRSFYFFIVIILFALPIFAQQEEPPDYRVQFIPPYQVSDDLQQITIRFGVTNTGGASDIPATASLLDLNNIGAEPIATARFRPLGGSGDTVADLEFTFPSSTFPPGSEQTLEITVAIGEVEDEDADTISNNSVSVFVEIPEYAEVQPTPSPTLTPEIQADNTIITIPFLEIDVDYTDPEQSLILAGIIASGLIMVIIIWMILRLLFRRRPKFGNWQPPYATMPPLDPNSIYGRRQMWQQHAQNNIVPMPCKPSSVQARKLLLGMDNVYLSGWKITALRMNQYDMYGRISRSEYLVSGGVVNKLNRIANKSTTLEPEKIKRRVRPIAKSLARQFKKKINKRSAMLPIALDVRFQGAHGEVRIVFELHECQQGQPVRLDRWEPEMTVLGKRIYESYAFTIIGQTGGENYRDFLRRFPDDLANALFTLVAPPYQEPVAQTQASMPPVPADTQNNNPA